MVAHLRYEQARATDEMNKVKARILIDKAPGILKEKGLTNSVDMRNAIIDTDPEYEEAKDRADRIEATVEYLKGKLKFMENAYTAVKKIIGEQQWNMTREAGRRQLTQTLDDPKFGKPLTKG
jgi:hydrogenase maturation factor HypE